MSRVDVRPRLSDPRRQHRNVQVDIQPRDVGSSRIWIGLRGRSDAGLIAVFHIPPPRVVGAVRTRRHAMSRAIRTRPVTARRVIRVGPGVGRSDTRRCPSLDIGGLRRGRANSPQAWKVKSPLLCASCAFVIPRSFTVSPVVGSVMTALPWTIVVFCSTSEMELSKSDPCRLIMS